MNCPHRYQIRIQGQLPENWSDWFAGLDIDTSTPEETTLSGCLSDQAELLGVLAKIHSLNIVLLSVGRQMR